MIIIHDLHNYQGSFLGWELNVGSRLGELLLKSLERTVKNF